MFTQDRVVARLQSDGVTLDGEEVDWSTVEQVLRPDSALDAFFGTDSFYRFDATVARPIEQPYHLDGTDYTFKKPEEELKAAQWRLDGAPMTLGHPFETAGMVVTSDQVHGVWESPRYIEHDDKPDEQRATLLIPTNDREAMEFVERATDVSVGFLNDLDWVEDEYTQTDGIDAYQRDLYYNHVALVDTGRCSREDGCGLDLDSATPTPARDKSGCSDGPCSCGLHKGTAYPTGRVKRAEDVRHADVSADAGQTETDSTTATTTMSDSQESGATPSLDDFLEGMAVDAVRTRNDSVDEQFEEYETTIDSLEDEKEDLAEKVDQLEAKLDSIESERDELREFKHEYQQEERDALVDDITEFTDHWDEEVMRDPEDGPALDTLRERKEALTDASASPTTMGDDGSTEESSSRETTADEMSDKEISHGVYDLSDTA